MIRRNIFCEKREREDDVKRGAQRSSPYCEHCRIFKYVERGMILMKENGDTSHTIESLTVGCDDFGKMHAQEHEVRRHVFLYTRGCRE
jgi:hypothetical protein